MITSATGCATTSSGRETTPTVIEKAPKLTQGGVTPRRASESDLPPARIVPVAEACRGERLVLDPELRPCACGEREHRIYDGNVVVRAGDWCGLAHPNETARANIRVSAERTVLAPGQGTSVLVHVTNPGSATSVYRVTNRHLWTDLVQKDGRPLPDAAHASRGYNDEAIFELPPNGALEIRVPVPGTYARHVGTGEEATIEQAALSPGVYAIAVVLGGLGGEGSRLVPIEVR